MSLEGEMVQDDSKFIEDAIQFLEDRIAILRGAGLKIAAENRKEKIDVEAEFYAWQKM